MNLIISILVSHDLLFDRRLYIEGQNLLSCSEPAEENNVIHEFQNQFSIRIADYSFEICTHTAAFHIIMPVKN